MNKLLKYRINSFDYGSNNIDYSYNSSGDRLSKTENTNTTNYNYSSNSHRLNSLTNYLSSSFTYDDNGNTVDNDNKDYTYNNANRLIGFTDNTQNYSYYINPLGQRIKKTNNNNNTSTYYIYDAFDRLIAEYDESDNLLNEYIYLNSTPIALRRSGNIYYIYPDDLGTPRHITDASNNPKWSWDNIEPFGNNSPNETISGSTFKFNLRFPGQYYDEESGLSYNYYRDYNSQIERYNESDPIGLSGGINTYAYVENNILSGVDFWGLDPWFNELYSKKIDLSNKQTIKWINKAREEKDPFYYLLMLREQGLDKYDSNLVAAERYCMSYQGLITRQKIKIIDYYIVSSFYSAKRLRNYNLFPGKNGSPSEDAGFTTKWGLEGLNDRK